MRLLTLLLASSLLQLPSLANADGNELLAQCQNVERYLDSEEVENTFAIGLCLGLLQGVRNTMVILNTGLDQRLRTCWPKTGINNGQAARIVVRYLREHPEQLNKDEVLLSMLAFQAAYPCNKSP